MLSGTLVKSYADVSPEYISEHLGESQHCQNLKFENFDKSQQKMESSGFIWAGCKDLC